MQHLNRHILSHTAIYECDSCSKTFNVRNNLKRHNKAVQGTRAEKRKETTACCDICSKTFSEVKYLTRHKKQVHKIQANACTFTCRNCKEKFNDYSSLFRHVTEHHPLNQQGSGVASSPKHLDTQNVPGPAPTQTTAVEIPDQQLSTDETALNNSVRNKNIYPTAEERYDVLTFFANSRVRVLARRLAGIKWNLCLQVEMQRDDRNDLKMSSPYFRSRTYSILSVDGMNEHDLNEAKQKMFASLETFKREDLG